MAKRPRNNGTLRYGVVVHPGAAADLDGIRRRIARDIDPATADRYVGRLRGTIAGLAALPHVGNVLRAGVRPIRYIGSHDRRYTIVFVVDDALRRVTVVRIAGGGLAIALPSRPPP